LIKTFKLLQRRCRKFAYVLDRNRPWASIYSVAIQSLAKKIKILKISIWMKAF